jgi:hypothetical protein
VEDHRRRAFEFLADLAQRNAKFLFETHLAFKNRRRTGHARARQQCRVNAASRSIGKSHTFPVRKLTDARLPHRRTTHAGDVHGVPRFLRFKLH